MEEAGRGSVGARSARRDCKAKLPMSFGEFGPFSEEARALEHRQTVSARSCRALRIRIVVRVWILEWTTQCTMISFPQSSQMIPRHMVAVTHIKGSDCSSRSLGSAEPPQRARPNGAASPQNRAASQRHRQLQSHTFPAAFCGQRAAMSHSSDFTDPDPVCTPWVHPWIYQIFIEDMCSFTQKSLHMIREWRKGIGGKLCVRPPTSQLRCR